jgi:integrase
MSKRDGLYRRGDSPFWWISRDPVTGKARSTRCRDRAAARAVLVARERAAADPSHHARSTATVAGCIGRLLDFRAGLGKPVGFHEQKLGHWARLLGDDALLADVDASAFDSFVAERRAEGVTDHTISKEVGCMLTALKLAKREGRYAGDLSVLRPMGFSKGYVPRTRALSPAELWALLDQFEGKRWAFLALAFGLGARRGEVLRLTAADFDLVAGKVVVSGTKTAGALRTLPILEPFRELVEQAVALLPLDSWARHSSNYLRDLRLACQRAAIPAVTPNDLRRTHATLLSTAGVGRDVARRLLGHSLKSTTLEVTYDQPKPAELAARAGDLSPLTRELRSARDDQKSRRAREDSNLRPTAPEALSSGEDGYIELGGASAAEWARAGLSVPTSALRERPALALVAVASRLRAFEARA